MSGTSAATSTAAPTPPPETPLIRNRDFSLLWSGQAVSSLGTQMSVVAYPLLILAATGSAAKAGLVSGATLIGTLVMLLPAGVVADRVPRRRILLTTSAVEAVAVATVAIAIFSGHVILPQLLAVGLIQGLAEAFYLGASRAAVRRVVPSGQLPAAMARVQAREQAAALAGPPLGGALFSLARFLPFGCDAISFSAVTLAAALMRKPLGPDPAERPAREPWRRSVGNGVRFVFAEPCLRTAAIWGAMVNAVAAGMLITVIVLARDRGATPAEIGALLSINAACGLAGSILAPRLIAKLPGRAMALVTSWLLPVCAVGIANAPSVWLIGLMGAITTFTIMPVNVILIVRATRMTPDHMQAQVFSASQLLKTSLMWAGPPVFGVLTDSLGSPSAILIAAGLYAAIAVWLQFNPEMRRLDEPPVPATAR